MTVDVDHLLGRPLELLLRQHLRLQISNEDILPRLQKLILDNTQITLLENARHLVVEFLISFQSYAEFGVLGLDVLFRLDLQLMLRNPILISLLVERREYTVCFSILANNSGRQALLENMAAAILLRRTDLNRLPKMILRLLRE